MWRGRKRHGRPWVDKVSPDRGPAAGGVPVQITGRNFNGASTVRFGSADATFQLVSDAEILVPQLPHGATCGAVDVVVTAHGESTPPGNRCFTYLAQPVITSVVCTGKGRNVRIVGRELVDVLGVYFGTEPADSYEQRDDGNVDARRHRGKAGPTPVTVVTPGGTSAAATVSFPADWVRGAVVGASALYMVCLITALVVYLDWPTFADHVHSPIGPLPLSVPWFGALGAVLLSISGLVEHFSDWDSSYITWHLLRPLIGAVMGSVGTLIIISGVIASTGSTPSDLGHGKEVFYDAVAFLIGYREETFRTLIKRLTDVVLGPGEKGAAGAAPDPGYTQAPR